MELTAQNNFVYGLERKKVSSRTSRVISLARFPLPMAVMAVHVFNSDPFVVKGITYAPLSYPLTTFMLDLVDKFIADFSVPAFFFISGLLFFAGGMNPEKYRNKLKRRSRSLLLPYLLWNLIAVVIAMLLYSPLGAKIAPSLEGKYFSMTLTEFISGFTVGEPVNSLPHAGNLWFVRELMTVILISPLIGYTIRKFRYVPIIIAWGVWAFGFVTECITYFQNITGALLFFTSGAYFSSFGLDPVEKFSRHWKLALCVFIAIGLLGMIFDGSTHLAYRSLKIFSVPCALMVLFAIMDKWGNLNLRNRLLGTTPLSQRMPGVAFVIFVAHGIIFWHFKVLIFAIIRPTSDMSFVVAFLVTYFGLFVLLIAFYMLLGKVSPLVQRMLSGRF